MRQTSDINEIPARIRFPYMCSISSFPQQATHEDANSFRPRVLQHVHPISLASHLQAGVDVKLYRKMAGKDAPDGGPQEKKWQDLSLQRSSEEVEGKRWLKEEVGTGDAKVSW